MERGSSFHRPYLRMHDIVCMYVCMYVCVCVCVCVCMSTRSLVKNLVLGYLHAPDRKKSEVLSLISKILDFTQEELDQVCGSGERRRGIRTYNACYASLSGSRKGIRLDF